MFERLTSDLPADTPHGFRSDSSVLSDMSTSPGPETPKQEFFDAEDGICHLLELPQEVLERILLFSDYRDILSAVQTCQTLRAVSNSPGIRYRLILDSAGYVDCVNRPRAPQPNILEEAGIGSRISPTVSTSPHTGKPRWSINSVVLADWPSEPADTARDVSNLSAVDKAKLLKERERRWEALDPAQIRTFQVKGTTGVYELQEGVLLMCESPGLYAKPRIVRLIPLPTVTDPDLEDPIVPSKAHRVSFQIADLTMDPTQDLIVISELDPKPDRPGRPAPAHKLHLLTLSSFEPHPLAARSVLDFPPVDVPAPMPKQLLQVLGDTLVVLVSREGANMLQQGDHRLAIFGIDMEEEMVAWNWKTGEVLARIHLGRSATECSFVLLTPTTVAIAMPAVVESLRPVRTAPPMIQIFSFAQRNPSQRIEQPLTFNRLDDTTPRAVPVARLLIPPLADGAGLFNFHMRPDPAFPPPSPEDAEKPGLGARPFAQDPGKGLIVCELIVASATAPHAEFQPQYFDFFVLREYLISVAEEGEARRRQGWKEGKSEREALKTFYWKDWGERNTRMLTKVMEGQREWVCSCSGYRYVSLLPSREGSDKLDLVVQDFNPYTVARERERRKQRGQGTDWILSDDGSFKSALWDEDEPTTIPQTPAWRNSVTTCLPFRCVQRAFTPPRGEGRKPTGVMMDAERIMLVARGQGWEVDFPSFRQDITVLCM